MHDKTQVSCFGNREQHAVLREFSKKANIGGNDFWQHILNIKHVHVRGFSHLLPQSFCMKKNIPKDFINVELN